MVGAVLLDQNQTLVGGLDDEIGILSGRTGKLPQDWCGSILNTEIAGSGTPKGDERRTKLVGVGRIIAQNIVHVAEGLQDTMDGAGRKPGAVSQFRDSVFVGILLENLQELHGTQEALDHPFASSMVTVASFSAAAFASASAFSAASFAAAAARSAAPSTARSTLARSSASSSGVLFGVIFT